MESLAAEELGTDCAGDGRGNGAAARREGSVAFVMVQQPTSRRRCSSMLNKPRPLESVTRIRSRNIFLLTGVSLSGDVISW